MSKYLRFDIVVASNSVSWIDGGRRASAQREWRVGIIRGGRVGVKEILFEIEREIAQLQRARALLKAGGSTNGFHTNVTRKHRRKKNRNLTPEGRRRIAEAQKRRWEKERRAATGK